MTTQYIAWRRFEDAYAASTLNNEGNWDCEEEDARLFATREECAAHIASLIKEEPTSYGYDYEAPKPMALCCDGEHEPNVDGGWRAAESGGLLVAVGCRNCMTRGRVEIVVANITWGEPNQPEGKTK
jgi:hypothetical protein